MSKATVSDPKTEIKSFWFEGTLKSMQPVSKGLHRFKFRLKVTSSS